MTAIGAPGELPPSLREELNRLAAKRNLRPVEATLAASRARAGVHLRAVPGAAQESAHAFPAVLFDPRAITGPLPWWAKD